MSVTQSNTGLYYCVVTYTLASGHIAVTGTVTLTVAAQILSCSLQHTEGDTVTLSCSLNGNYMFPEWRGPPSFTTYTLQDDRFGQINPAVPAASRLSYASNNRDLLLINVVVADSGEYRCSYAGLGDHTITLTITETATTSSRCNDEGKQLKGSAVITPFSSSNIATTTKTTRTTNTNITSTICNNSGRTTGNSNNTISTSATYTTTFTNAENKSIDVYIIIGISAGSALLILMVVLCLYRRIVKKI